MPQDLHPLLRDLSPLTVGAITDPDALSFQISPADCDLVELRLDVLGDGPEVLRFVLELNPALPLLITARHPDEGGADRRNVTNREGLLRGLLDQAAVIDLELRSLVELSALWAEAGQRTLLRVASFHDFEATPPLDQLRARIEAAAAAGADVAKLAFRIREPRDLLRIIELFQEPSPLPLSVMGMGPLAPSSRLLAAQLGSVLNYGYLGSQPTAPGQWPAPQLKRVLMASPTPASHQ